MAIVISMLLLLLALCQAKHLRPIRRSPTSKIDPKEYASALESAGLNNTQELTVTPWPPAPYTVNFPGSRSNALVFTDLQDSGTGIQTVALVSLLQTIISRLVVRYPDPKYNILAVVPDISAIGLGAFLFELRYTTPSTGDPAKQGSKDSLDTVRGQIVEHGIKTLKASIKIGTLKVGDVQVDTTSVPLQIPRTHLPLFVAVSSVAGPTVEITQIGQPYSSEFVEPLFEATEEAVDYLNARPPQEQFTAVEGRSVEATSGRILRFFMLAAGSGRFTNAAAAAVTMAIDDFFVDFAPGDMSFEIFEANSRYRLLAEGRITVLPGGQQAVGDSATDPASTS